MYELDGTPNDLDPRHVLRRVLDRYAADGLTPVAACELEFYLVDMARGPNGEVLPARSVRTGRRPAGIQVYGLPEIEDHAPFLRELWDTADVLGLPLEGAISEFAPAQLELTLHHKPDAMAAADDAVRYKRAVKGIAPRHGCEATFMAKPWADRAGSGFHVHLSFADASSANLCADDRVEGSDLLRHAIGGMKALMSDCMAILAPNANSYRRFRANSYAPVAPTWGVNNRTVSLRVPAGAAGARARPCAPAPPFGRELPCPVRGAAARPVAGRGDSDHGKARPCRGRTGPSGPPPRVSRQPPVDDAALSAARPFHLWRDHCVV
jgi:glutamine synthetase